MLYLGILSKNGTRSIYEVETSKEIACIRQIEIKGKVFVEVKPKTFLTNNHVEEYETWLKIIENKIQAEEHTKGKSILYAKIDDEDFCKSIKKLHPNYVNV